MGCHFAMSAASADSLAEKVKICNTCGDAGFDDCLAFCNQCNEGAEHVYCMVTVFDTVPPDWICEGCKVKQNENSRKRRLVCDGIRPAQSQKKQVVGNSSSAKNIRSWHNSSIKEDSFENGTEHFVTLQAAKAPSKRPAHGVLSMGRATVKEKPLVERYQPPFSDMLIQKLNADVSNERNTACKVAPDANKPPLSVTLARNLSAKVSSGSQTHKSPSTSRCDDDMKKITQKGLPNVSPDTFTETKNISTVSNSQLGSLVSQLVKETSGKTVGIEEQELHNIVMTSLAEGKQLSAKAEHLNVNETVALSVPFLAKPEKEEMEVISGMGKLFEAEHQSLDKTNNFSLASLPKPVATDNKSMEVSSQKCKVGRTASTHIIPTSERDTINPSAEVSKDTDTWIRRPTSNPQLSLAKSTFVKSESTKVASSSITDKVVPICKIAPICEVSIVERKNVNADENAPNHMNISIEKPRSNSQDAVNCSMSLRLESMKGTSCCGVGNVVSACRTAPLLTTLLSERSEEDVPDHRISSPDRLVVDEDTTILMNTSIEKPTSNAQDSVINSTSLQLESIKGTPSCEAACRIAPIHTTLLSERNDEDVQDHRISSPDRPVAKLQVLVSKTKSWKSEASKLVKRGGLCACKVAIRDFPVITQNIRFLGEKGEKNSTLKSKEKLPSKITPPGVEQLLCEQIVGGNVLVEEDAAVLQEINGSNDKEHQESGGFLVNGMTIRQETDSSCDCLKAKEEEIPLRARVELASLLNVEEKAQPQNIKHKDEAAGSQSCLIGGPAECPSLLPEGETMQSQNVQQRARMASLLSCLRTGSVEPPCEGEMEENAKWKAGAAGSPSCLIENSGLGKVELEGRTIPHSAPAIERNEESIFLSPCMTKGYSCEIVPMQESYMSLASGAGMDKIPNLHPKRVAKRDFPPLKVQIGKAGKSMSTSCKPKVTNPSEKEEQVTVIRSDADTEEVTRGNVPAIAWEVLPRKLKNGTRSISMGNLTRVVMPLENEKRLSVVFIGNDESNEPAILASSSLHTKPEDKECHDNTKQECDATCLASCVQRELPTDGVPSARDEVALVIKTVYRNFEPASKINTTNKNLSSPQEGSSSKGVPNSKRVEGSPCLPRDMVGVTVKDTSNNKLSEKEVFGRGSLSRSDGLGVLSNGPVEGECVDLTGGCHNLRQKGEALTATAASSCQARSSGNISLVEGGVRRDASNATSAKVTFTGKPLPSIEVDYDSADRDLSDEVTFSPDRHTSRSECAFNRSTHMTDDCEQLSFFESRQRDSVRLNKGAVHDSISSIRERRRNTTYIEREYEGDGFYDRRKDAGCEPLDQMGLRKSTLAVRPRHHTLPDRDGEFRSVKQDHHSRGSRLEARESSSSKGAYRCHRCSSISHSAEFCKADRQKEWRTPSSLNLDDKDLDSSHGRRDFTGFPFSDGRKRCRYDPEREKRFMNSRSHEDLDAVDCDRCTKRPPPKVFEHSRYHEESRYKLHVREEASFERDTSRLETPDSLNGMRSELRSFPKFKQPEYTRVHERQILRVQTPDSCKVDTYCENGKVFPVQRNVSSYPAGPAAVLRSGHVNRPLPKQVPSMTQDQYCKDRVSQTHAPPQLDGPSIRNLSRERRAAPDLQVMWTGCFYVFSKTGWKTCYQGFQACPSKLAHSKVFEALLTLPLKLEMEENKRGVETDSWPRSFQESPPTSRSIGIYFFPTDAESYSRWYKPLIKRLAAHDLALKVNLEFAQLLIFPSQILPEAEQFWDDRFFLWGVFRRKVEDPSPLLRQPSCRDLGSDLGSPEGNGEVIDMDVDTAGGEDAVVL